MLKPQRQAPKETSCPSRSAHRKITGLSAAESKPPTTDNAPRLLDAVRDQHQTPWVRYGTNRHAEWVPVSDFARNEVFIRLARLDPRLIKRSAQHTLQNEIAGQGLGSFRPALVAAAPGWIDHHFVLGDGTVLAPGLNPSEVIVAFEPYAKFAAMGSLKLWQSDIAALVQHQPFAVFALSLALVGPLLPFAPPDYISAQFEVVGATGSGKSTLGYVAASVWAGDPDSSHGGGETWNLTSGRFDEIKLTHRHLLLLLDEANLAGSTVEARRQLIQQAIFSFADSGARQRMGDPSRKPHAQLAVLSTSNRALSDLIEGSPSERAAMHERMITITIAKDRPHGVFDFVPSGFRDAAAAAEALNAAVKSHWGTAGPEFVRRIQIQLDRDEANFRGVLARALAKKRTLLSGTVSEPRVQKCLALVICAGILARHWGILPRAWGSPQTAVLKIAQGLAGLQATKSQDARGQIRAYASRNRTGLVQVAELGGPLTAQAFEATAGFRLQREGSEYLLIPARRFQVEFPNFAVLMRELRARGHVRTEVGRKAKLTIKTPRAICHSGRVYCIELDTRWLQESERASG